MLPRRLLELVGSPGSSTGSTGPTLARASRPMARIEPETFLAHAPGLARGFFERGSRWTASAGVAAGIEIHAGSLPPRPSGRNGSDPAGYPLDRVQVHEPSERTQVLRERAQRLVEGVHGPGSEDRIRLHGGLAFTPAHEAEGEWIGFPSARFVIPALELVHDPKGTRLIATVRTGSERAKDALERAEQALDRAIDALENEAPRPLAHPIARLDRPSERTAWNQGVEEALARIGKGQLDKAVLARTLDVDAGGRPDPTVALRNLRAQNPGSNIFYVEPRPGHVFLGASPEIIGQLKGRVFETEAVAGSTPRGQDPDEDDRLARELLSSGKDREEHDIVVRWMRERLERVAERIEVGRDTRILRLNRVQHLERPLHAHVGPDEHVLDLVEALHPTPAVGGTPVEPAMRFLARVEPFERGWYAGPVGWFDARGDGAFAPGLRCAVLDRTTWRLFAGAGIVAGSEAAAEWRETNLKLEPLLRALGLPGVDPAGG